MKFNDNFIWMVNENFADKNAKFSLRRNTLFRRSTKSETIVESYFFFFLHQVVLFPKFSLIFICQNVNLCSLFYQFFYGFIFTDKYLCNFQCILSAKVKDLKNKRLFETWLILTFYLQGLLITILLKCLQQQQQQQKLYRRR